MNLAWVCFFSRAHYVRIPAGLCASLSEGLCASLSEGLSEGQGWKIDGFHELCDQEVSFKKDSSSLIIYQPAYYG